MPVRPFGSWNKPGAEISTRSLSPLQPITDIVVGREQGEGNPHALRPRRAHRIDAHRGNRFLAVPIVRMNGGSGVHSPPPLLFGLSGRPRRDLEMERPPL